MFSTIFSDISESTTTGHRIQHPKDDTPQEAELRDQAEKVLRSIMGPVKVGLASHKGTTDFLFIEGGKVFDAMRSTPPGTTEFMKAQDAALEVIDRGYAALVSHFGRHFGPNRRGSIPVKVGGRTALLPAYSFFKRPLLDSLKMPPGQSLSAEELDFQVGEIRSEVERAIQDRLTGFGHTRAKAKKITSVLLNRFSTELEKLIKSA